MENSQTGMLKPFPTSIHKNSESSMEILGIDIGGSGVKGAPVESKTGTLTRDRLRITTPQPATPKAVVATITEIVAHFDWRGKVGCGFPTIVQNVVVKSAANISKKWIGQNA